MVPREDTREIWKNASTEYRESFAVEWKIEGLYCQESYPNSKHTYNHYEKC